MSDSISRLNAALEGRYRIESELGEGGMATVYLAADLRHERKVALKVLKPELAAVVGAERFLAEIKTTANLQHPHILPLHDSGEADSLLFYVMPHVDGESLRDRLDRERQLPVDDAVGIATNMAEALDYAHRQGVIHRDIKPANVLLQDGKPVIADFGIALAVGAAGGGRLTETGLSLGTPHYMSPEQATGSLNVGAATDTYALGCVLYEMLVGEPPFTGSTPQAVLGKIVTGDAPSASAERKSVPAHVEAAIRRALEKVPADRLASAADFRAALLDPAFRHGEPGQATAATGASPWNRLTAGLAAATAVLAIALAWTVLAPGPALDPPVATRALLEGLDDDPARSGWRVTVSPDGQWIVAGHREPGEDAALYVRAAGDVEWTRLQGTEDGTSPTFSPDGRELAFTRRGEGILRIALAGGPALPVGQGGSPHWASDDLIVYSRQRALYQIRPSGGSPELLLASDTLRLGQPRMLPGGEAVVFGMGRTRETNLLYRVGIYEFGSGELRELVAAGTRPLYASTGHLLFGTFDQGLMGVSFDLESLETTGSPVSVVPDLTVSGVDAQYGVSHAGTLVYLSGRREPLASPMWVDRSGRATAIDPGWPPHEYDANESSVALSPSGDRLAFTMEGEEPSTSNVYVKELDDGPLTQVTVEEGRNRRAVWTPDGEALVFPSNRSGRQELWWMRADGLGSATPLMTAEHRIEEVRYARTGEWVVFRSTPVGGGDDIFAYQPAGDSVPIPLFVSDANEQSPALSPDGRWIAYVSDVSGRDEVYVHPFPDVEARRVQVSISGGLEPMWANSGRELFYRSAGDSLIAARLELTPTISVATREPLFSTAAYAPPSGRHQTYDVDTDDERFVMFQVEDAGATSLYLVASWFTELREKIGGS